MFDCLSQGSEVYLPPKFWDALNRKNLDQLKSNGLKNFKQTIAQNYFTWIVGHKDKQFKYLLRKTNLLDWPSILKGMFTYDADSPLRRKQQRRLTIFTKMLWKYAESNDSENLLKSLDEPEIGNPLKIFLNNKLISQDLANSLLEYYSIRECFNIPSSESVTICELGAGYGRNAHVFVNAFPRCKYLIVDIPPALYVAQHYLTSVFRDKKIFTFRCFDDFDKVKEEFQDADIAFLLPHQVELLPKKKIDLFINISSLHEMKMEQIHAYFKLIDSMTTGFFFTKQWLVSRNPADGIVVTAEDYPIPNNWRQLYHRTSKVQSYFFEAMYAINPHNSA